MEILLPKETGGATHVMVMVVVPVDVTCTEVGGSGLGGAIKTMCSYHNTIILL